jgi:hypothetical protein
MDAYEALTWRLARRAENGYLLDEKQWVYKQAGSKKHNVPGLIALYIIDNFQVTVLSIQVVVPWPLFLGALFAFPFHGRRPTLTPSCRPPGAKFS